MGIAGMIPFFLILLFNNLKEGDMKRKNLGMIVIISVGTNTQLTINRKRLASGMYFYKLIDENKEVIGIGKMVIE